MEKKKFYPPTIEVKSKDYLDVIASSGPFAGEDDPFGDNGGIG